MKKIAYHALVALLALCLFSCHKKVEEPAEPLEHFNCYIDGKYWTFKQHIPFMDGPLSDDLSADYIGLDSPYFEIHASAPDLFPQTVFEFHIDVDEMSKSDTIRLLGLPKKSYASVMRPFIQNEGFLGYKTIGDKNGWLIFNKITPEFVEGIFEFEATNGSKSVNITNGKFKIAR